MREEEGRREGGGERRSLVLASFETSRDPFRIHALLTCLSCSLYTERRRIRRSHRSTERSFENSRRGQGFLEGEVSSSFSSVSSNHTALLTLTSTSFHRAAIEEDYSRKLLKLSKQPLGRDEIGCVASFSLSLSSLLLQEKLKADRFLPFQFSSSRSGYSSYGNSVSGSSSSGTHGCDAK